MLDILARPCTPVKPSKAVEPVSGYIFSIAIARVCGWPTSLEVGEAMTADGCAKCIIESPMSGGHGPPGRSFP